MGTPLAETCPVCGKELPRYQGHYRIYCSRPCNQRAAVRRRLGRPIADAVQVEGMRACRKCGETKPFTAEFFPPTGNGDQTLRWECRECHKLRIARYRALKAAARDAMLAAHAREFGSPPRIKVPFEVCTICGQAKPKDSVHFQPLKERGYRLRAECRDCSSERGKRDYRRDPQAKIRKSTAYLKAHPEMVREATRRYSDRNPGRSTEWARKNPERHIAKRHRRRASELQAPGSHTAEDVEAVYQAQAGCCLYCGRPVGRKYEVDHIIPLIRGGSNDPDNLAISCTPCNRSKGYKMPWEFMPEKFAPPEGLDPEPPSGG